WRGSVDFAGHAPGSGAAYRAALQAADQRVGRLVAAVRTRPSGPEEDWTIVVVTDHGHLDEGGAAGSGRSRLPSASRVSAHARTTPTPTAAPPTASLNVCAPM